MRHMFNKIYKVLFNLALVAAISSVNITCNRKYYQEELTGQLEGLRKYKDE